MIGQAISDLLTFFRETFPDESITPKLHLLEDHVCPFIEKWGASFGLYGEQGMEGFTCGYEWIEEIVFIHAKYKREINICNERTLYENKSVWKVCGSKI